MSLASRFISNSLFRKSWSVGDDRIPSGPCVSMTLHETNNAAREIALIYSHYAYVWLRFEVVWRTLKDGRMCRLRWGSTTWSRAGNDAPSEWPDPGFSDVKSFQNHFQVDLLLAMALNKPFSLVKQYLEKDFDVRKTSQCAPFCLISIFNLRW